VLGLVVAASVGTGFAHSAGPGSVAIPTKQTPLAKPPAEPQAPPQYGQVFDVETTQSRTRIWVAFVFARQPVSGAQIRTTWYYNNRKIGEVIKQRQAAVSTLLSTGGQLPTGYWRCALEVRLAGGPWHAIKEAQILLR
jgi:hypothetical protein